MILGIVILFATCTIIIGVYGSGQVARLRQNQEAGLAAGEDRDRKTRKRHRKALKATGRVLEVAVIGQLPPEFQEAARQAWKDEMRELKRKEKKK